MSAIIGAPGRTFPWSDGIGGAYGAGPLASSTVMLTGATGATLLPGDYVVDPPVGLGGFAGFTGPSPGLSGVPLPQGSVFAGLGGGLSLSGDAAVRLTEFDRLASAADSQQAGLNNQQWVLVREQFNMMSRDFERMRQEMAAVIQLAQKNEARTQQNLMCVQTVQGELEREAQARQKDDESVLKEMVALKQAVDKDATARVIRIEENTRNTKISLDMIEAERLERSRQLAALEAQATAGQRALQLALETERGERVKGWEASKAELIQVRAAAERESRDRDSADRALEEAVRRALAELEQERADRQLLAGVLDERCGAIRGELAQEHEQNAAVKREVDRKFVESSDNLAQEKAIREAEHVRTIEALDGLRANLQDQVTRLQQEQQAATREYRDQLLEHRAAVDLRIQQERSARDEQNGATLQQLQAKETELRREIGRVLEESLAGDDKLRKMLSDQQEAQDRALRAEISRVTTEYKTDCQRLRETDVSQGEAIDLLSRQLQDSVQELGDQVQTNDESMRREVGRLAADLQANVNALRAADGALKDHFDRADQDLRREILQTRAELQAGDKRLKEGQDSLASQIDQVSSKLKDGISALQHQDRAIEQNLRGELGRVADQVNQGLARLTENIDQVDASLRGELGRVQSELSALITQVRGQVEQRYALVDSMLLKEQGAREAGDSALLERIASLDRKEGEDESMQTNNREALRAETQGALQNVSQRLEGERAQRFEQERVFNERLNALQASLEQEWQVKLARSDFEIEAKRLWEAVDSHTHQMQPPPPQVIVEERIVQAPPQIIVEERIVQAPPTQTVVMAAPPKTGSTMVMAAPPQMEPVAMMPGAMGSMSIRGVGPVRGGLRGGSFVA